jgi:tetratricopeptide (TPR) repeat protein
VDVPEVLRWRGLALLGLKRLQEAQQTLAEAYALAKEMVAHLHLLPILIDLAEVNSKLGKRQEAAENLAEARTLATQMAESLREIGLHDSFMNQPRIQRLMR